MTMDLLRSAEDEIRRLRAELADRDARIERDRVLGQSLLAAVARVRELCAARDRVSPGQYTDFDEETANIRTAIEGNQT